MANHPQPLPPHNPPPSLTSRLKSSLAGATRVAILAVGSELRGDDNAGLAVAEKLRVAWASRVARASRPRVSRASRPRVAQTSCPCPVEIFMGHTAPENLTGVIRRFAPSHLLVLDAAHHGAAPGELLLVAPDQIEQASFGTHKLPLKLMLDYLCQTDPIRVVIVGIQPGQTEFGSAMSADVIAAVDHVAAAVAEALA